MDFITKSLLSLVIFLPLVGAIVVACLKRPAEEADSYGASGSAKSGDAAKTVRYVTLFFALLTFAASLALLRGFDRNIHGFQFVNGPWAWIANYNIFYHVGIDGTSLLLLLLTTFTSVLAV